MLRTPRLFRAAQSPCGSKLLAATTNGLSALVLVDVATGQTVQSFKTPIHFPEVVRFSPDGKLLAQAGLAGYGREKALGRAAPICLFDVATGLLLRSLEGNRSTVHDLSFAPDGKTLASAAADGTVFLWDMVVLELDRASFPWTGSPHPSSAQTLDQHTAHARQD